ncbi:CHAD domain-containing protein [Aeromonas jandaei]|uniref:CHAD domain-containing protein n=1 Tax=Aeromonas jandaei TaxID=650 RepID=UPI000F54B45B|nr:CHAD domain-containing protein [Aeromonas jandaei]RQM72660.1 CHAD domain-containing protein [Aeromonas jandaei]
MGADTRDPLLARARVLVASYRHAARAVRREASEPHVHGYRIAARRMQALLALWRPALCHPKLERRLQRAIGRLSALRDAQVYATRFGASSTIVLPKVTVPLFSGLLARWLDALEQTPDTSGLARHYRRHLARRLDGALSRLDEHPAGNSHRQQLRRWHHLRLEIKQARYGAELLLELGAGEAQWVSAFSHWQERLGQLQDWRQWRRALKGNKRQRRVRCKLKRKIVTRLRRLDCQQAELVGLKVVMLDSPL